MTDKPNDSPDSADEGRTVFMPATPPEPTGPASAPPPEPTAVPATGQPLRTEGPFQSGFAPRTDGQRIQVGDVLNHIFEVKRFIARGGMGEVFEGANVNSDERVAIKVMLPALAADPNVIGMFRKEARTLTRLNHEALVNYRVLAQEPQLGILYIVTEYVDGTNLSDVLGALRPTPEELSALLRRLASGLRTAHQLGAIHRDISPDNVLLEDGRLEGAKVIDFGIAKDLDPGSATIVGDGFAGKLSYVAPEQLGDFGREIGPWTDVYSLALVIMAVAQGKNVPMGGSLVDAVDKRRAGPDLSGIPGEIRPVLESMLKANPAERLRSMDEVLAMLDLCALPAIATALPPVAAERPPARSNTGLIAAAGVAALMLVAVAAWLLLGRGSAPPAVGPGAPVVAAAGAPQDPVAAARSLVDATLPSVNCTWLDIVDITRGANGPLIKLTGVAGNPSAAQSEIARALQQQKIAGADIDFGEVAQITQSGCAVLNAYRQVRLPEGHRLSSAQRTYEIRMQPANATESGYAGENAANIVLRFDIGDPKLDFAVFGLEPSGIVQYEFAGPGEGLFDRTEVANLVKMRPNVLRDLGGDHYQLSTAVNHAGWSGILMITGKGPFEREVVAPPLGGRGPDWVNKFTSIAAEKGWQTDMVWFRTVDQVKE